MFMHNRRTVENTLVHTYGILKHNTEYELTFNAFIESVKRDD